MNVKRQRVAFSLLQAWYCIVEGGVFLLLNLQFFLGKSETVPRAWLIPLMLIQIAGLGVGNFGLSKKLVLGPWTVLVHGLVMCLLAVVSLPFRESFNVFSLMVPLVLHGALAFGAWRALRIPSDAQA